jgi:hypothetical protein
MASHWWIARLRLARQAHSTWYRDRLREELRERYAAQTAWERLSETSDVYFTILRAHRDKHPLRNLPRFRFWRDTPVYSYMVVKYTSRWGFYRLAAVICSGRRYCLVSEVINPMKDHKLEEVAIRNNMDPVTFKQICCRLRRVWPLLP